MKVFIKIFDKKVDFNNIYIDCLFNFKEFSRTAKKIQTNNQIFGSSVFLFNLSNYPDFLYHLVSVLIYEFYSQNTNILVVWLSRLNLENFKVMTFLRLLIIWFQFEDYLRFILKMVVSLVFLFINSFEF